ncbi:MAG: hypothetical protein U0441_25960 [Polyangiaceae bacterium]
MVDLNRIAGFLREKRDVILATAGETMERAHLPHYPHPGQREPMDRLTALYDIVLGCATDHNLSPIASYAHKIARERHAAGIQLSEVQTAINVLEESIWRAILSDVTPDQQGETLGVVGTILGQVKDKLACAYVEIATHHATRTLDFKELFHGVDEGHEEPETD